MYLHGRNVLKELLGLRNSNIKVKRVLFTDQKNVDSQLEHLIKETRDKGLRVEILSPEKLTNLSREKKHQGVVIELKEFPYTDADAFLNDSSPSKKSTLVLLDQIQDPHNLGAIIRTSVAAGVDAIAITTSNSAKITPAVVKVSAGLVFKIPVIPVGNLARFQEKLKGNGYWIYATDMSGVAYYEVEYNDKVAMIFGNEGKGVRRLVKERSDLLVSIPMEKTVDSLNVAASAAILLFDRRRRIIIGERSQLSTTPG